MTDTPNKIAPEQLVVGSVDGKLLDFVRQITRSGGIEIVGSVPNAFQGAVLYLKHPRIVSTGNTEDHLITPGFVSPDFYGYSNGTMLDKKGVLSGHIEPISLIGSYVGQKTEANAVTQWSPDFIGSMSRSWLDGFKAAWLGGFRYNLSPSFYHLGGWLKGVINKRTFNNGNSVTFNLVENDNNVYFRVNEKVTSPAGLLWWNTRTNSYSLLQSGIDVGPALPAVAGLSRRSLVAVGAAAKTGLNGTPNFRRSAAVDTVQFRADPLGAGRIGFTTLQLGDNLYQGKAIPSGGALTPPIPGVLALYEQPIPAGGSKIVLVSDTKAGSPLRLLGTSIRIDLQGVEAAVLAYDGLVNEKRTWSVTRLASEGLLFLKPKTYELKIYDVTATAYLSLHSGDYLSPLADITTLDTVITDIEERLLQEGENNQQIVSIGTKPIPAINIHNFERLHIDHRSPRAWIGEYFPGPTTPGSASSAFTLLSGHWLGALSDDPAFSNPAINHDDVYYNRVQHQFRKRTRSLPTYVVWETVDFVEFSSLFAGTGLSYWLGERDNANDAAQHVPLPIVLANKYYFYSKSSGQVEIITTNTFVAPTNPRSSYRAIALVNATDIRKELLADHTLPSMQISGLRWESAEAIPFSRALTPADDDRLISVHLRWEERSPSVATTLIHRSFGTTIDGLTFRSLGERIFEASAGKVVNTGTMNESADWFARRPNYTGSGLDTFAEMKISYSRYRTPNGRDGIAIHLAAGSTALSWSSTKTKIGNFQGRFMLHH